MNVSFYFYYFLFTFSKTTGRRYLFFCEEKICSCLILEQELEETRDELQRVTEAESLLRSRCSCLEEKQRREKDQIEVEPYVAIQ